MHGLLLSIYLYYLIENLISKELISDMIETKE